MIENGSYRFHLKIKIPSWAVGLVFSMIAFAGMVTVALYMTNWQHAEQQVKIQRYLTEHNCVCR